MLRPGLAGSFCRSSHAEYSPSMQNGVFRSRDQGMTWKSIGGPPGVADCRTIYAVTDNLLFMLDSLGNIWTTTNSGGDSVLDPGTGILTVSPRTLFDKDTVQCAGSLTRMVTTDHTGCSPPSITHWSIEGTDAASYSIGATDYGSISVILRPQHLGALIARLIIFRDDGKNDTISLGGFRLDPPNSLLCSPLSLFAKDTLLCADTIACGIR